MEYFWLNQHTQVNVALVSLVPLPWHGPWCCRWLERRLWPKESLPSLFLPEPRNKECPDYWGLPPSRPCICINTKKYFTQASSIRGYFFPNDYRMMQSEVITSLPNITPTAGHRPCQCDNGGRRMSKEKHINGWEAAVWLDCRLSLNSLTLPCSSGSL